VLGRFFVAHAVLEILDRAANPASELRQAVRAEDDDDDHQDDDQLRQTNSTHSVTPFAAEVDCTILRPSIAVLP
jgi:hypothetical protein